MGSRLGSEVRSRLGINGSFLAQPQTGVQRYARNMIAALTALERTFQIVVLGPPTAPDPLPDLGDLLIRDDSALPLPVWVQCKLPLICRQQEIDLLWCPGNMGPLAVPNQLLTIHDASPFANPRWFSRLFGLYTRASWPLLARRVRRVVTDSKFSRSELQRFGITTSREAEVVPCGVDEFWKPVPRTDATSGLGHFVLALGGGNPRKNIAASINAWRLLDRDLRQDHRLVVVGSDNAIFAKDEARGGSDVLTLPPVDDVTLRELYSGARAFLYPSLYEGFGLPPLEAMACGTVCVVSNGSSLPEVLQDSALYCDPLQPDTIARALDTALRDENERAELKRRGLETVKQYPWQHAAERLARIIESELR